MVTAHRSHLDYLDAALERVSAASAGRLREGLAALAVRATVPGSSARSAAA